MSETNGAGWLNKNWKLLVLVSVIVGAGLNSYAVSEKVEKLEVLATSNQAKIIRSTLLDSVQRADIIKRLKRIEKAVGVSDE